MESLSKKTASTLALSAMLATAAAPAQADQTTDSHERLKLAAAESIGKELRLSALPSITSSIRSQILGNPDDGSLLQQIPNLKIFRSAEKDTEAETESKTSSTSIHSAMASSEDTHQPQKEHLHDLTHQIIDIGGVTNAEGNLGGEAIYTITFPIGHSGWSFDVSPVDAELIQHTLHIEKDGHETKQKTGRFTVGPTLALGWMTPNQKWEFEAAVGGGISLTETPEKMVSARMVKAEVKANFFLDPNNGVYVGGAAGFLTGLPGKITDEGIEREHTVVEPIFFAGYRRDFSF